MVELINQHRNHVEIGNKTQFAMPVTSPVQSNEAPQTAAKTATTTSSTNDGNPYGMFVLFALLEVFLKLFTGMDIDLDGSDNDGQSRDNNKKGVESSFLGGLDDLLFGGTDKPSQKRKRTSNYSGSKFYKSSNALRESQRHMHKHDGDEFHMAAVMNPSTHEYEVKGWDSEYYKPRDFADGHNIQDKTGGVMISKEMVEKLDIVTEQFGKGKLTINSGYRSPESNLRRAESGADGPHTHGNAVDINVRNLSQDEKNRLYSLLRAQGFNAFGFGKGALHAEIREGKHGRGRGGDIEWTYNNTDKYQLVDVTDDINRYAQNHEHGHEHHQTDKVYAENLPTKAKAEQEEPSLVDRALDWVGLG